MIAGNRKPNIAGDVFANLEDMEDPAEVQAKEAMREEILKWHQYQKTVDGQRAIRLAQPKITHLKSLLALDTLSFRKMLNGTAPNLTMEEVNEYRAEIRGMISVWEDLLYKRESLEEQIKQMEKRKKLEKEVKNTELERIKKLV